jgi:putative endonuclease
MSNPCMYILASKPNGTLYIGVTSNLIARIWQHKNHEAKGFTQKYEVGTLVYFELYGNMLEAIQREKQLKKWRRGWKIELIEKENPKWRDLYFEII